MRDTNKQLMFEIWRAVGAHDLDAVAACYQEDAVYHAASGDLRGREAIVDYFRAYIAAFPDIQGDVELIVSEGDLVAHQARLSGTNTGDFMGIPATGNRVEASGMLMSRVAGGKVIEEWESFDQAEIMRQLGLVGATQ